MTDSVERECFGKVNIFLRVLGREADGYHGIETCYCHLNLSDSLRVSRIERGIELEIEGPDLGPTAENLAVRAATAVLDATGNRFGVRIHLVKRIPVRAGLGGGSSNGAGALLAINALAHDAMPRAELLHTASRLGADVAFFASESPYALAWGHGQRLLRLPALPALPALLVLPDCAVSTADAYRWIDQGRQAATGRGAVVLDPDVLHNWNDLARLAGNDFESVVFGRYPTVRAAFEALARTGPLLCRMSGSGAALFAGYRDAPARDDAAQRLGTRWGRVMATTIGGTPGQSD